MNDFILGAAAMGALCVALFFLRFWRRSLDSFHLLFAAAFLLVAVQRALVSLFETQTESIPVLYLPRLAAYLLIIVAVARKNVREPTRRS
jgi:hypothetical protein